ncbi:hypothetical protein D9M71_848580 [compost metagenome]
MGLHAVAGDAEDHGVGFLEGRILVAETLAFDGAARGAVLRIEVQHDLLALQRGKLHLLAAGGLGLEVADGLVD